MLTAYLLTHYLIPHQSNNQRPKLIHSTTIVLITAIFLIYQGLLQFVPYTGLKVLGFASQISIEEVVNLTNQRRAEIGLSPLRVNPQLAQAAHAKGEHMIAQDYWAHVAPDGTDPWSFFKNAGYRYKYAGENLARDFSNASSAVDAWMASPTHKDNMLSSKYSEIGIAVVEGDLGGVDTTIIVQFFGTTLAEASQIVPVAAAQGDTTKVLTEEATPVDTEEVVEVNQTAPKEKEIVTTALAQSPAESVGVSGKVKISPFATTKGISLIVVGLLLFVFLLDWVFVAKQNIARIAGRTLAHIAFLGMVLAIVLILKAGRII